MSLVRSRAFRTAINLVSSRQTRDLECFAESSNTPWNPPTIFCPDLIATILQRCLLSLCALSGGERFCNAVVTILFMKFLEPTRKTKVIYTDNSLEFGKSCEEFFWDHCPSTPHKSETNTIAERADCYAIHFLFCDLTKIVRSGHDCTSKSSARSPRYCLRVDIAIWVLRKVRVDTMLTRTRFHFCSRLHG